MSFPLLLNMLLFFYIHTFSELVDFAMPASQNGIKFGGGGGVMGFKQKITCRKNQKHVNSFK